MSHASPPDDQSNDALLAKLPMVLLALGIACGVSAAIGLVLAALGRPAPLPLLLAPPLLVIGALPIILLRGVNEAPRE